MRGARLAYSVALLIATVLAPGPARALPPTFPPAAPRSVPEPPAPPQSARFALIVGVNKSVDPEAVPLRYADDDAARYLDLFRSLGAQSYLLARLDENTQRLHPQAAAEAAAPTRIEFSRAVDRLATDLARARERGVPTVLYFVYAGHGTVKNERGYISLEDARLGAVDLETELVDKLGATETHFIVDACYSYFLVMGRGPGGGRRREVHGFSQLGSLATRPGVGLLLSTSSARESHEWAGFQAGVFSHEVRSGLYGAADADGDGQVTYREMVAFIERANASVANERFRPDVFARAAGDSGVFVDLREGQKRRIDVRGTDAGHYLLEDTLGVRIADFNTAGQNVSLLRPATAGQLYLRRMKDEAEFVIPGAPDVVEVAALTPQHVPVQGRGAANDAFSSLFSLPFRAEDVRDLRLRPAPDLVIPPDDDGPPVPWTRYAGMSLLGVSLVSGVAGVATLISANSLKQEVGSTSSQADAAAINDKIAVRKVTGGLELAVAGVTAFTGLAFLLWPSTPPPVSAEASAHGGAVHFHASF